MNLVIEELDFKYLKINVFWNVIKIKAGREWELGVGKL
jgi:hypothetical protein